MAIDVCDECGGKLVIVNGQLVCSSCGLVKGYVNVDWPFQMGNVSREGVVGSEIQLDRSVKRSRVLRRLNRQLKTWQSKRMPYRIKQVIERAGEKIGLPHHVIERAKVLYVKSHKSLKESNLGISTYSLSAAALLVAIWEIDHAPPLTIEEMTEIYRSLGHRVVARTLARAVSIVKRFSNVKPTPSILLRKYTVRITNVLISQNIIRIRLKKQRKFRRLKIPLEYYKSLIIERAASLAEELPLKLKQGKNPYIVAASLVYIAEQLVAKNLGIKPAFSQKLVAKYTGISEYSVRDNAVRLIRALGIDLSFNLGHHRSSSTSNS